MNTIPKIDSGYIDSSAGAIEITGNKLDFALTSKDTYFKVKDKNGDIFYTRDGSFKVLDGKLVTQNGFNVLDKNDKEIITKNGITVGDTNIDNISNNNYLSANLSINKIKFNTNNKAGHNLYKALPSTTIKKVSINGYDNSSDIVLTTDSYNKLYHDSSSSAIETIKNTMFSKSLLFLGFSLDDVYIQQLLKDIIKIFGNTSTKHYVILKKAF